MNSIEEAEKAALDAVSQMLQRSDQFEKLPELKKKADRKRAAIDAIVRTGVQSQLEGVRTAMAHLNTAFEDIRAIDGLIGGIFDRLKLISMFKERMKELRAANATHVQYTAAKENLKHLYNLNPILDGTRKALEEGNLLVAHKNIMDLELARDELLLEVHRLNSSHREYEMNLLVTYFTSVNELVKELERNMWFIVGRTLEMVKGGESGSGPVELVTCLRIIEREERIDKYYNDMLRRHDKFVPPGRPRKWRSKVYEVLEKTVWSRVEGNQLEEDRTVNKAWLARYLEVCRKVVVDDLLLARAAIPCFPPDYQIYDRFVQMYHNRLCNRIREITSEGTMDKKELVQLMSWIRSYVGEDFLGNRRLQINVPALLQDVPILPRQTQNQLCDEFVEMTRSDMKRWLEKTLSAEKDDWYKPLKPETDNHSYYYTSLPSIIFNMLRDNMSITKEISAELIPSVINLTMEEFSEFASNYKDALTAYKNKQWETRQFPFTATVIAFANNIHMCIESTEKYVQHVRLSMESDEDTGSRRGPSRHVILENINKLIKRWNSLINLAVTYLREDVLLDIGKFLDQLFSRPWLTGESDPMGTINITLRDFVEDYRALRPAARQALLTDLQFRIIGEYLKGIDSRRLVFSNVEERRKASQRFNFDIKSLRDAINRFRELDDARDASEQLIDPTPLLSKISSILSMTDKSLILLEVNDLYRSYANMPVELFSAILACREDISRSEAKTLAEETHLSVTHHPKNPLYAQIFAYAQQEGSWRPAISVTNVLPSFMRRE